MMNYDESRLTPDDEFHHFGNCFDMLCDEKRREDDKEIAEDIEWQKRQLKRRGGIDDAERIH